MSFSKNHVDAIIPTKGSVNQVGFDLYSYKESILYPNEPGNYVNLVDTGISVQFPEKFYGEIRPVPELTENGLDIKISIIEPVRTVFKNNIHCTKLY
jgi:dUTPase